MTDILFIYRDLIIHFHVGSLPVAIVVYMWNRKISHSDDFHLKQIAQVSQRDRAVEWVSCGQKWKTR